MKTHRLLFVNLLLLVMFNLTGCALISSLFGKVPAQIDIEDKAICVVPFSVIKRGNKKLHFESKRGEQVAQRLSAFINSQVSGVKVLRVESIRSDVGTSRFSEPNWKAICEKHDLDLIIVGALAEFRAKDPLTPASLQGYAVVQLKIIDKEGNITFTAESKHHYPKLNSANELFHTTGMGVNDEKIETVKDQLSSRIALDISRLFYAYTEDD